MSNVPFHYHEKKKGIINKPSCKKYLIIYSAMTSLLVFLFLALTISYAEYIGKFEFQYAINRNTGEYMGVLGTLVSYIGVFVIALVGYGALMLLSQIITPRIMGDELADELYNNISIINTIISIASALLVTFLDVFQIFDLI